MVPSEDEARSNGKSPPAFNVPPATLWTALFLIGVFLLCRFGPQAWAYWALEHLAFSAQYLATAWNAGRVGLIELLPLLTYSILHLDLLHLLLNVGLLVAFGALIERVHGKFGFAVFFLGSALCGALVQLAVLGDQPGTMIGASGAVYGMIGAAAPLMFWSRQGYRWRKGLGFIAVIMLLNIVIGPLSMSFDLFGAPIAWQAHIGGFAFGLVLGIILILKRLGRLRGR